LDNQQHLLGGEGLDVGNSPAPMNDGDNRIELNGQNISKVDINPRAELVSSINAESVDEAPHVLVFDPDNPPSESILEVSSPTTPLHTNTMDTSAGYILPFRNNRGKPPNRYSPNIEDI
jgi:hypothetical protein